MNANYDDPKYTAYVLGELDEAECAAVEAELRDDPQLAAAVAEIRSATERLSRALQTEHLPKWRAGQLAALLAVADGAAVEGRELNGAAPSGSSPSPPAPLPSRERGEERNGEVEGEGDLVERADEVPVASRPRRLSWRGRLLAAGTLAAAVGLMVAVLVPAISKQYSSSKSVARANGDGLGDVDDASLNFTGGSIINPEQKVANKDYLKRVQELQFTSEGKPADNADAAARAEFKAADKSGFNYQALPQVNNPSENHQNRRYYTNALPQIKPSAGTQPANPPVSGSTSLSTLTRNVHNQQQGAQDGQEPPEEMVRGALARDPMSAALQGRSGKEFGLNKTNESLMQRSPRGGQAGGKQDQQQGQQQDAPQGRGRYAETQPNAKDRGAVDKLHLGVEFDRSKESEVQLRRGESDLKDLPALEPREKGLAEGRRHDFDDEFGGGGLGGGRGPNQFGKGFGDGRDAWAFEAQHNTEAYDYVNDNPFLGSGENPLSTFSIDVDTASYSNIRRFLMQQRQRPPRGAVRIEELVNYFRYDYPQPEGDQPFSVTTEVASCPWEPEHRLVRIGLKGREIPQDKRPPSNLVFLIDVSGSMSPENKLPLVKRSLKMLAEQLGENDKVSMVVYAGNSGLVLPSTRGDQREAIMDAIDRLNAGGSTNGAQGIELAYEIATNNLIPGKAVNRVILATDGDFNVGVTNRDELVRLIEEKAKTGVFLTTLGYGMGNIKDSTLEQLADKGNGSYAYIDDLGEARKVLVEELASTLVPIAKDVKIQVEFNPAEVASYRLIGYENRVLAKEDFNDDKKDAGEIGAGHTVTALYEVTPVAKAEGGRGKAEEKESAGKPVSGAADGPPADAGVEIVDSLKYQQPAKLSEAAKTGELFTLKLRYKQPDGDKSTLIETPVKDAGKKYREASEDFKFAAAVASFGMILRDSPFKGGATIAAVEELAGEGVVKKDDKQQTDASYRAEFVEMVKRAKALGAP